MPAAVCKVIICGSPWLAVKGSADLVADDPDIDAKQRAAIQMVGENAFNNWRMAQKMSEGADNATAAAIDVWSHQGADASTDLLLYLTGN